MRNTNSLRQSCREFWQGATRSSPTALVIALSLTGAAFAALCLVVTSELMIGPNYRYFMSSGFDTHTRATSRALAIRDSQTPAVVVFGDSITNMCFKSNEHPADHVAGTSREMPVVYNLATDNQTAWEMAALADRLPMRFDGVLVLGASRMLLSHDVALLSRIASHPRLGFTSEVLDTEARLAGFDVPYRTRIFFLDNLGFFLARRFAIPRNLLRGPPPDGDPLNAPWVAHVYREEFWQQEIAALPEEIKQYDANKHLNFAVLKRLITQIRERGDISFVLLEPPINPRWYGEATSATFFRRYREDLRQFAAEQGVSFLSVSEEAALLAADFVDYEGHIGTPSARERCAATITSWVAGISSEPHS